MESSMHRLRSIVVALCALVVAFGAGAARATTVRTVWVIRDARLKARVMRAVEEYLTLTMGDTASAGRLAADRRGEVAVEALESMEDNTRRVVALEVDTVRIAPTERVRVALGENLYEFITGRTGYEYDLTRTTEEDRLSALLWWPQERVVLSLDRQMVRLSNAFAVTNEIGNQSVQLPFWQYGMFRLGVAHPNFRLLLQGPFAPSITDVGFLKRRYIDGAFGAAFEFRVENWSGEAAYATISRKTSLYQTFAPAPFLAYYNYLVQVRYGLSVMVMPFGAVELTLGIGAHQIKLDTVGPDAPYYLYDASREEGLRVSPIVRASFVSRNDDVEATAQFYNASLLFSANVRVYGSLWLTGSYVTFKALRSPDIWEPSSFFYVSPMVRF